MQADGEWLLVVRDASDELRVVAKNAEPVEWRRLTNVLRGWKYKATLELVDECAATSCAVAGRCCAAPVMGPDGKAPHAFLVSLDSPQTAGVPSVGSWTWDFEDPAAPPVLSFSESAFDLLGVALAHRDRTLYGPADYFTRTIRLADILTHLAFLYDSPTGARRIARTPFRGDDGTAQDLHVAEVVTGDASTRAVRGLTWTAAAPNPLQRSIEIADNELAVLLANNSNQLVLIGDLRFPTAPYVLKWVTPHPPGIGRGISNGQAAGLHPDDLGKLIEYVLMLGYLTPGQEVPEISDVRVRRAGGGWMNGHGKGFRLDPDHFPTIWVALIAEMAR